MSTEHTSPPISSPTSIHESDLAGIRAAAQWLLVAFGGIALVVVAGIQLADAWQVITQLDWRTWLTIGGLILVGVGLWRLAVAAVRVLVPDRASLTDLLTQQSLDGAEAVNIAVGEPGSDALEHGLSGTSQSKSQHSKKVHNRSDSQDVNRHVLGEISRARGWLLPQDCRDLDAVYQKFGASSGTEHENLRLRLKEVAAFSRSEAAFYRYWELRRQLLGVSGLLVILGLVLLVLGCHAPPTATNPVTRPTPVQVQFVSDRKSLEKQGLAGCAGLSASGVAVGGSLSEPEVVLNGTPGCPRKKVIVTSDVGTALPAVLDTDG